MHLKLLLIHIWMCIRVRTITIPTPGEDVEALVLAEVPDPTPAPGEVVIDVAAAGVNRADLLQRRGFYPPPPGASPLPGLEAVSYTHLDVYKRQV